MVLAIFIALVLMVRMVLDSSKILVDRSMLINPYYIEWEKESNGLLRLNDPFYLPTNAAFLRENLDKLKVDTSIYNSLILKSNSGGTLADVQEPYLIWKKEGNDTIHVLKNSILLNFKLNPKN